MNDIKIVCCDIDGTLLRNDKSLSDENRCWIAKAIEEKNIKFVIVSGRMFSALNHFNNTLGVRGLSSCLNGTLLVDENGKVLASHTLSYEDALRVVEVKEANKAEMLCISENTWYTESHEGPLYNNKLSMYMQDSVIANPRDLIKTTPINKFLFASPDKAVLDKIQNEISSSSLPGQYSYYAGPGFLEIMTGGITKGTAVDDLISYYNVDRSQVMALGDDVNDVEMIQKAGLGIAMGNALDCVKKIASAVTDTNEKDGVAKAIQKYIFNN